eukprot:4273943-Pleurochrysis_carterae.AAC.1
MRLTPPSHQILTRAYAPPAAAATEKAHGKALQTARQTALQSKPPCSTRSTGTSTGSYGTSRHSHERSTRRQHNISFASSSYSHTTDSPSFGAQAGHTEMTHEALDRHQA